MKAILLAGGLGAGDPKSLLRTTPLLRAQQAVTPAHDQNNGVTAKSPVRDVN